MVVILVGLLDMKTSLRGLHINGHELTNATLSLAIKENICALLIQNRHLTHVSICPTRRSFHSLCTLSTLKSLNPKCSEDLVFIEPVDALQSCDSPFPALDTLNISTPNINVAIILLKGSGCFAKREIRIISEDSCNSDNFSAILEVAIDPAHSRDLRSFILLSGDAWEDDEDFYPGSQITLHNFRPLLSLRKLEVFKTYNKHPVVLDDDDLHLIASAWNKIMLLAISFPENGNRRLESRVTLRGIAHLSTCSKLKYLGLNFMPPATDDLESLTASAGINSPLEFLDVNRSVIGSNCVVAVTIFLLEHFPMLRHVIGRRNVPMDVQSRWGEIEAGLQSLRVMKNRMKIE